MKILSIGAMAMICASLAVPAVAKKPKVYSGDEARAISCAHIIYMTGTAGYVGGYISRNDAQAMQAHAIKILHYYTSGNTKQKVKAMKIMAERKSLAQTHQEFVKRTKGCVRKFPV